MVPRERVFRHERGATHASLRVDNCQFAPGFESANMRKNRRPQGQTSPLCLLTVEFRPLVRDIQDQATVVAGAISGSPTSSSKSVR